MKDDIMNKDFWKATLIRAIRTFCQAAVAAIPTTAVALNEVNWMLVFSAAALASILSILTSIAAGLPEVTYQQSLEQLADLRPEPVVEEEGELDGDAD